MGKELPFSPDTPALVGMDFAGTVEQLGEGVCGFSFGDEVYGCAGGLAGLTGTPVLRIPPFSLVLWKGSIGTTLISAFLTPWGKPAMLERLWVLLIGPLLQSAGCCSPGYWPIL